MNTWDYKTTNKNTYKMEKLNREEILCLIRKMGGVAIRLRNTSIHVVVTYQKYVNFLTELSIDDLKYVAGNYIRSVANLFDYEGVIEYDFAFDSIIIAAKATILKNSYIESATLDETNTIIDDRWIEDNDNYDDDNCDNDSDDDPDEINYKIQAEMEQYMFENGKDYDDYQEPQLYDTEEDYPHSEYDEIDREIDEEEERKRKEMEELDAQYSTKDNLIDSLNNDLDDCLSKD